MQVTWKKVLKFTSYVVAAVITVVLIGVVRLALPGKPHAAKSMHFDGFIKLPKGKHALNILDYVTIVGDDLFVTGESDGSVYKVNLRDGVHDDASVQTFQGDGAAHGVAIDPISHLAFVTRSEANMVDVFEPGRLQLIKHIPVAEDADGIFYDPANKLIYVGHGDPHLITLIDPVKQESISSIKLSGKPEFAAFDPITKLFYQNLEDADKVAVIDTARQTVVQEWPLLGCQGPTPMAIDAPNRRLFLACSGNATLIVLDLNSHQVVTSIAIGGGPDAIAFDPELHRLYVTGKAGVLSVIQVNAPDSYTLLDSIKTHYGAHTLGLDPVTHRVYVAYASLFAPPRLAVFSPIR